MCECTCGAFSAEHKFPGPEGSTYVLTVFPGCRNCDAPCGVDLHHIHTAAMTHEDEREWMRGEIDGAKDIKFWKVTDGHEQAAIGVIEPHVLAEVIVDHGGDDIDNFSRASSVVEDSIRRSKDYFEAARTKTTTLEGNE